MQTCYAKWLSTCSGYCELKCYVCRVELSLLFIIFYFVVFLLSTDVICFMYYHFYDEL